MLYIANILVCSMNWVLTLVEGRPFRIHETKNFSRIAQSKYILSQKWYVKVAVHQITVSERKHGKFGYGMNPYAWESKVHPIPIPISGPPAKIFPARVLVFHMSWPMRTNRGISGQTANTCIANEWVSQTRCIEICLNVEAGFPDSACACAHDGDGKIFDEVLPRYRISKNRWPRE